MVDSIETPAQPPRTRAGRLRELASRRGLIGAAGVFSIIAGGFIGAVWLWAHRSIWEFEYKCFVLSASTSWFRHSLTLMAFSTAIVAAVALAAIAGSRGVPRRLVSTYWISSLALWATLAVMMFMLLSTSACERRAGL